MRHLPDDTTRTNAIDMSEMVNDDETIHFGDKNNDPTADTEAVIYFG